MSTTTRTRGVAPIATKGNVRALPNRDVIDASTTKARLALARHLSGAGIEIGPGHAPFPLPPFGATVRYVDRWTPEINQALFPELGAAAFRVPDLTVDLDRDGLAPVTDGSVDFVVASHVLEHVADPLRVLSEMHRVLRPGGTAIVLLPDRRRTFDAGRPPTTLGHLIEEHDAGVTEVSDDHIVDFVANVDPAASPPTPETIALHRRRSIHVHCWSEAEFAEVIVHVIAAMAQTWQLVDGLHTGDPASVGIEFGLVLRTSDVTGDAGERAVRFRTDWQHWIAATGVPDTTELHRQIDGLSRRIAALEASTSWRATAPLRWLTRWIRQTP